MIWDLKGIKPASYRNIFTQHDLETQPSPSLCDLNKSPADRGVNWAIHILNLNYNLTSPFSFNSVTYFRMGPKDK